MENQEAEILTICFYYNNGCSKTDFLQKDKGNIVVPRENVTLVQLKKILVEHFGIKQKAKEFGWSDFGINLSRSRKIAGGGADLFTMATDIQVRLELPRIINGEDKLHAKIYAIEARFRSNAPRITIEVTEGSSNQPESSRIKKSKMEEIDVPFLKTEFEELSGSTLVASSDGRTVKLKGKTRIWPWNIHCGVCKIKVMVRLDATSKGRIDYFKQKHYNSCVERASKQKHEKKQKTIKQLFAERPAKKARVVVDSDIEISSDEEVDKDSDRFQKSFDSDLELSDHPSESDEPLPTAESESETVCDSEVDVIADANEFDESWRFLAMTDVEADPVCRRLDKLIRDGQIPKDRIFYKYLDDITQIYYDSKHPYDKDVLEYFASIVHHGGESTYNMVRGPMGFGNKNDVTKETRMNLGGPGIETLRKQKAAYTTSSGVLKYLSLLHYRLLKNVNESDDGTTFINNNKVEVYPVAFSNDGTALKPAIQFDEDRNLNVGLESKELTYDFCKSKPFIEKETLVDTIVCEAVVSSVTSLDNDVCLPVAATYSSKNGKSGENIKSTFSKQVRLVQMCENCSMKVKDPDMVLPTDAFTICESYCNECFTNNVVCGECEVKGHTEVAPSLRACNNCLKHSIKCVRRVVLVITVDCESGNKLCLKQYQQELVDKTIDPHLAMLSLLPDVPHVLKTCKASFANWYLQLINERGCLSLFYTLRNRADPDVRKHVQSYLKSNDFVRNRDRQNPSGVMALCNPALLSYIQSLGFVTHTIVPETIRFTQMNRKGAYPNVSSVAVGMHGSLLFLCENETGSTIYKAKLHNPISEIVKLSDGCNGNRIRHQSGLVYCYGGSSVFFYPVDKAFDPKFVASKLKSKKAVVEKLSLLTLPVNGTLSACKERLSKHQKNVLLKYKHRKENAVIFYDGEDIASYRSDAITFIESDGMYVAFGDERFISLCPLKFNSVGIEAKVNPQIEYLPEWDNVVEIEVMGTELVISHNRGISLMNLESKSINQILVDHSPKCMVSYQDGFLFPSVNCLYFWKKSGLEVFAGKVGEEGSRDGTTSYCRFYECAGVAVEFNNVVYCVDKRVGSIKIMTTLSQTAKFLMGLGSIVDAFSVHEKHQKYSLKSLDEAISLVSSCDEMISTNIESIRSVVNHQKCLNGPEGSISAATTESIKILLWGLKRLRENVESYGYRKTNLLSCMTLTVENLHSAVNKKQGTQTLIQYAQSFSESIKESIKSISQWSVHYFTSRERWYPVAETAIKLHDLDFPKRRKKTKENLSADQKQEMREWASINGAVVRQRTCRQETTMARAGTLPQNAYFEELVPIQEAAGSQAKGTEQNRETEEEEIAKEIEEVPQYESDSDNGESSLDDVGVPDVTTFLVGRSSRYGRSVTFNRKYIS